MIITTIIAGLITLLTPIVFPIIFQNFILFEKIGKTQKEHKNNVLIFIFLTIASITFLLPKIFIDKELVLDIANNKKIDYWLIFPLFIIIIWISFSFIEKLKFLTEGKYLIGLRFITIVYFCFRLFIGSLSGIGPIMGTLLIENDKTYFASLGYSIGITMPLLALMLVLSYKYDYIKNKKWWKAIQIITLIYLFIALIQKSVLL